MSDRRCAICGIELKGTHHCNDADCIQALQESLIAANARADAALSVIEAARCIRHWHDAHNEGMIVSAEHVMKLWQALTDYDNPPEDKP